MGFAAPETNTICLNSLHTKSLSGKKSHDYIPNHCLEKTQYHTSRPPPNISPQLIIIITKFTTSHNSPKTTHHSNLYFPMATTFTFTSPSQKPPSFLPTSSRTTPFLQSYSLPRQIPKIPSIFIKPNNKKISRTRQLSISVSALSKLSETESVTVPSDSELIPGIFPSSTGVYAVYDASNDLQFVGISRNVAASVVTHKKTVPDLCSSVKVGVVEDPDRTALTQAWKTWMEEHIAATGKVPPGNETGNTTWVRQPPKRKADLRLTPGRHVQLTVPLEELIDKLVKENKVVAFIKGTRTAPLCGFSQRVVGILETVGVDYESVDVLDEEYNNGLRESLKSYSNWPTFPQVFVDGELIGGCDILTAMYEKGELANMLKK